MGKYFDELEKAMNYLGQKEDTVFIGQAVEYAGTSMTNTLKNVPKEKLIEMPVCEEMQMGITNGLAVNGSVPISIYLKEYSHEEYVPKAIIRTGIGSIRPLNPQVQHTGDFTEVFRGMLRNIEVIRCEEPEDIFPAYEKAYNRKDGKSTIIVEYGDYFGEK